MLNSQYPTRYLSYWASIRASTMKPRTCVAIVAVAILPASAELLYGQASDTVAPMPAYGSKEVDTSHIEIPGYSGPENERALIILGCQNAVRARLRAPAAAKFMLGPAVLTDDNSITVVGRVEAMNAMGGYGVMRYECVGGTGKDGWVYPAVTLDDISKP